MPHQAYMLGMMLIAFAIGFIVYAKPRLGTVAFVTLLLCLPALAVFLDTKYVPYSFWLTDGSSDTGGLVLGWGMYFGISFAGTVAGVVYRKLRFPDAYKTSTA